MQIITLLKSTLATFSAAEILLYLLAMNLVTFALYGADKRAAVQQGPRIPEKALHILALAGGTPAAYFAQRHFRHKTRKGSFQAVFWLTVVVQAGVLAAIMLG